ncbi:hypothetical protein NP233_g7607 [Leucocoprinus birnbaumii]|uniref:Metacaspase-1 n=1 Tax=Leucocoprinus birnbaumii TaxID=56174 RepID=A0AAD5VNW1_9AGAR|nr:hypothetical protein NP233_g7607 [Leucocoprinus birnbaumii]
MTRRTIIYSPTRKTLEREMTNLVTGPIEEGDEFFIYYAGHATQRKESVPNTERDHQDECELSFMFLSSLSTEPSNVSDLLPMDALPVDNDPKNTVLGNALIDDRLREILVQPLIQADVGCQLIAVMDACTSGTILDLDHDECNKVIGWKSRCYRILRSPPALQSLKYLPASTQEYELASPTGLEILCSRVTEHARLYSSRDLRQICISACEDSQTIVELPDGKTLAGNLDVYLRRCKRPVLKKLNRHIYKQFKKTHRKLWKSYNEEMAYHKKNQRIEPPKQPPALDKPQITSLKPLRMNTTLKL